MTSTIYFSGSISGGRQDVAQYRRIVAALESAGHNVLAGAVASETIGAGGEALDATAIFDRDLQWIEQSDLVVAEVSMPSLGVGYEIAAARYRYSISVICLYRPAYTRRCSAMISGDRGIQLIEYEEEGFDAMIARLLEAVAASAEGTEAH